VAAATGGIPPAAGPIAVRFPKTGKGEPWDITLAVGDGARRMTYDELAQARGISLGSARQLSRRHRWPRQVGNDGIARVTVPLGLCAWRSARSSQIAQYAHCATMRSFSAQASWRAWERSQSKPLPLSKGFSPARTGPAATRRAPPRATAPETPAVKP
jgi:hypothetical protein